MKTLYAAKNIAVGVHPTWHIFHLTIDYDIVTSTLLVAAAIFLFLGFRMRQEGDARRRAGQVAAHLGDDHR